MPTCRDGHQAAGFPRGCPDQIRSRRDPGKSRGHRGGAVPHPERHRRRHRTYQLPRSRFHRKHGAQNPRASQHRRENHRRTDRRMCGGVLWRRRAGIPDGAEAGVSVLPHREGDAVFRSGAAEYPGGLPEIRHVPVRGRGENGLRSGGGGQRPDIEGFRGADGRVLHRRDEVRRTVRRGAGHYRAQASVPLQGLHEAARRGAGQGLADGSAIRDHAGKRRVF